LLAFGGLVKPECKRKMCEKSRVPEKEEGKKRLEALFC
jgi:hypothetical protein